MAINHVLRKVKKYPYLIAVIAVLVLSIPVGIINTFNEQGSTVTRAQVATSTNLYVSPGGLDTNTGESADVPLKTIQAALNKAVPGTTIYLGEGIYRERIYTKAHGLPSAPITLKGPETGKDKAGRYKAVLYGTSRIVNVDHSYYIFDGFTIDGQEKLAGTVYPTTLSAARAFKDSIQSNVVDSKLIYIGSGDTTKNLTGIQITNMFLHGAGTECVRIRNNAQNNLIENNVIQWCGLFGKGDDVEQYKYHNGEGVYIGTSPKSTTQPMYANDGSSYNVIRNNTIYTFGSECFNVKENAHDNTFENNDCRYNDEPTSFLGSLIELRGYNNKILGNILNGSRGYALKMKSDSSSYTQGGNFAQNNAFSEISGASIRNDQTTPQGLFCGNTFSGTILTGTSVGNPTAPCPGPTSTPAPTLTATPIPTVMLSNTPTPTNVPIATPTSQPTPTSSQTTITFSKLIAQGSDDAEERLANGNIELTGAIQMVTDSGRAQQVGLRFQGVTIPKGAIITNAYIEFTADFGSSDATNLNFYGENVANSQTFTTAKFNITSRAKTSSFVNWNAPPAWVNNGKYQTPNLSPVIQQIINNPNWTSGNSLSIIVTGSGKRVAKSYNQSPTNAPRLVITYK